MIKPTPIVDNKRYNLSDEETAEIIEKINKGRLGGFVYEYVNKLRLLDEAGMYVESYYKSYPEACDSLTNEDYDEIIENYESDYDHDQESWGGESAMSLAVNDFLEQRTEEIRGKAV